MIVGGGGESGGRSMRPVYASALISVGLVVVFLATYRSSNTGTALVRIAENATGMDNDWRQSIAHISFPARMRQDETRTLSIDYSVSLGPPDNRTLTTLRSLDSPLRMSVESSGFDIAPAGELVEPPSTALPVVARWSMTPKGPGHREILVRFVERHQSGRSLTHAAFVNDSAVAVDSGGWIVLSTSVSTTLGFAPETAVVMGGIVAFLGFLLGWPPLIAWIKSRTKMA